MVSCPVGHHCSCCNIDCTCYNTFLFVANFVAVAALSWNPGPWYFPVWWKIESGLPTNKTCMFFFINGWKGCSCGKDGSNCVTTFPDWDILMISNTTSKHVLKRMPKLPWAQAWSSSSAAAIFPSGAYSMYVSNNATPPLQPDMSWTLLPISYHFPTHTYTCILGPAFAIHASLLGWCNMAQQLAGPGTLAAQAMRSTGTQWETADS